jgi:hypothetical protein
MAGPPDDALPDAFAAAVDYLTTNFPDVISDIVAGRPVGNPSAAAYPFVDEDGKAGDAVTFVADLLPVRGAATQTVPRNEAVAALEAARRARELSNDRWLLSADPVLPYGSPADLDLARRIDRIEDPDREIDKLVEGGFFSPHLPTQRREQLIRWGLPRAAALHDAATARTAYLQHHARSAAVLRRTPAADERHRPVRLAVFLDPAWQHDPRKMEQWLARIERLVEDAFPHNVAGDFTVEVDGVEVPVSTEQGPADLIISRVAPPPPGWMPD